jgi:hypothetical protein
VISETVVITVASVRRRRGLGGYRDDIPVTARLD